MGEWRDGQFAGFPSLLAEVLDEPDPEQLELARTLLTLPSCPLRQTDIVPRAGRGSARERTWRSWGESIHAAGFATEPLGRYARSLRRLPRRYWHVPLAEFTSSSWQDLRRRPWWGKAKLTLLWETLHDLVVTLRTVQTTVVEKDLPVTRARIARLYFLEQRLSAMWEDQEGVEERVLRHELVPLLLDQLEGDVGNRARRLMAQRLLPSGRSSTRDRHAEQLRITRARYYQLWRECRVALRLRWPEGAWLFRLWAHRVSQRPDGDEREQLLRRLDAELFGNSEDSEF